MAHGLDEQLHETCGGIFSHSIPASALAGGVSLVPGKMCIHTELSWILTHGVTSTRR